jgi:hypothetical protein
LPPSRIAAFDRTVHAERGPSALVQHTPHLAHRSWLIRKELESELTENNVEVAGWKRQVERTPLRPADQVVLARNIAGNSKHPGVQIETRDPSRPHLPGGQACHDPVPQATSSTRLREVARDGRGLPPTLR